MNRADVEAFFARLEAEPAPSAWPLLQLVERRLGLARAAVIAEADLGRSGARLAAQAGVSRGALETQAKLAKSLLAQPALVDQLRHGRRTVRQVTELATALDGVEPEKATEITRFVLRRVDGAQPPSVHREAVRAVVDALDHEAARERRAKALVRRG